MIKIRLAVVLGGALLACSAGARAAAPPTPVPDMKPDLSSMAFFIGTWSCHSTVRGSARPNTTTFTMDYGGRWIKAHDIAPPFDRYRTRAITTDSWVTYDRDAHRWVQTFVDNFGGYGINTSPGWNGNAMTWTTALTPDGSSGSDTLTKVSNTETRDVSNGKDKNGNMQPSVTAVCRKQ